MSVRATIVSNLTIIETVGDTYASSADNTVTLNGMNETISRTGSSTPAVTKSAAFRVTMSGGAATINLAALSGLNGATIDLTGLKLQAIKFRNLSTNANDITIVPGAANGYNIFGAADGKVVLSPGQSILMSLQDQGQDVASGDRTIDISGTGSQVLEVTLVAG